MKKIYFVVFNLLSLALASQTNLWSYYWGFGPTIKIQHTSKNIGYYSIYNDDGFSSDSYRLVKTIDGGSSFKEIGIFQNQIKDFFFVNDTKGYLTDANNFFYKTTDGGTTWYNITPRSSAYGIEKICFFTENVGFSSDSSMHIFKTTDGSKTWSRLSTISGDKIFFLKDNRTGWIGNSVTGKLYKTLDAGSTWTLTYTDSSLYKAYTGMFFVDSLRGWFLSSDSNTSAENAKLYKTDDGGLTWSQIYNNSYTKFKNLVFKNSSVGIAVGYNGIYKTENSGYTWDYVSSYNLNASSATDVFDDTFFISGIYGLHMKTTDPSNWDYSMRLGNASNSFSEYNTRLVSDNANLYNVSHGYDLSTRQTEYYISKIKSDGTRYESKKTGIPVTGSDKVVYQLNFQNVDSFWFLNSLPFRSTDKGDSWTPLYNSLQPALNYRFVTTKFFTNNIGIGLSKHYIGDTYKILKTNNSGDTWEIVKEFEENTFYSDSHFFNQNVGLVVNSKGEILKTYNGGATWSVRYTKSSLSGRGFRKLFFVNENVGFAVESGTIAKTMDGGETWNDLNMDSSGVCSLIKDINFINESKGWISTSCGIYRTNNGGITWVKESDRTFEYIYMFSDNQGFATSEHTYYQYHPQPASTSLINPMNDQTNVPLNIQFQWKPTENAEAYYVSLGKTTSYDTFYKTMTSNNYLQLESLLEPNTTYYINIVPFNSANQANNNIVYKFKTGNSLQTSETDIKKTFYISPNPSKDFLHIYNNLSSDFKIYDFTGKNIKEGKIEKNTIEIKNIPNGTYILQIGQETKKFIKF